MSKYIELHVQKVNPMKAPQVAGALLDADGSEDFVRALILSVRAMAPAEQLVEEVEKRNWPSCCSRGSRRASTRACRRRRCTTR